MGAQGYNRFTLTEQNFDDPIYDLGKDPVKAGAQYDRDPEISDLERAVVEAAVARETAKRKAHAEGTLGWNVYRFMELDGEIIKPLTLLLQPERLISPTHSLAAQTPVSRTA